MNRWLHNVNKLDGKGIGTINSFYNNSWFNQNLSKNLRLLHITHEWLCSASDIHPWLPVTILLKHRSNWLWFSHAVMRLRWKYFIIRLELESKFRMRQLTLQAHLVRFNPHTSASAQQTRPGDVNKEMKCNCPMKAKLKEVSDRWCDGAAVCPREEEDSISWPFSHSVNARLPAGLFGSQRSWNCLLKWTFLKLNDFLCEP